MREKMSYGKRLAAMKVAEAASEAYVARQAMNEAWDHYAAAEVDNEALEIATDLATGVFDKAQVALRQAVIAYRRFN